MTALTPDELETLRRTPVALAAMAKISSGPGLHVHNLVRRGLLAMTEERQGAGVCGSPDAWVYDLTDAGRAALADA